MGPWIGTVLFRQFRSALHGPSGPWLPASYLLAAVSANHGSGGEESEYE